jgi:hypothetical membrane protein
MKIHYNSEFFSFIAILIFILGFIGGTILSIDLYYESINWTLFLSTLVYVFLIGSVFLFFSAVVSYLEMIFMELRTSNREFKKSNDKN